MAAGALVSMPLTGHILDGRSSAAVTRVATLLFCLMLPLPLLATSPIMLAAILFVFGASNGAMDVAMNAHGVAVERTLVEADHVLAPRRLERRRLRLLRAWSRSPLRRESTRGWRAWSSVSRSGCPRSGSPAGWGAHRPSPRREAGSRCPLAPCS